MFDCNRSYTSVSCVHAWTFKTRGFEHRFITPQAKCAQKTKYRYEFLASHTFLCLTITMTFLAITLPAHKPKFAKISTAATHMYVGMVTWDGVVCSGCNKILLVGFSSVCNVQDTPIPLVYAQSCTHH